MNQYKKINSFLLIAAFSLCWTACFNDLDTIPIDPDEITAATVYDDPSAYKQVLAKLYAGLAVTGQEGPSGQSDISGIDEGFGQYIRAFWHHQTLTTEEAVVGWNDQTIQDFHNHNWDANDTFIAAFYYRIFYQVSVCNEFLRETTDEKLTERSVDAALREEIQTFRAEARFLRALSYWHALDHFRNVPFVTENDPVGSFFPPQTNANDLFNYIESELLAIEDQMLTPQSEYGRADQAAAWILLAKLYLNAEVYVDQDKATEALTYCNKILGAGYRLDDNYEHLFMADNHLSSEIIFPVIYDGVNTRTWGGTTFLTRAGLGGNMIPSDFGVLSGWGGIRVTSALVNKFPTVAGQSGGLIVEPGESEDHPFINMPGTYSNWAQADENTRLSSPDDNGVYEGYIWFEAPTDFRIIENESLLTSYGDAGSGNLVLNGGGNIQIPSAGFYRIEVDLNNLTYSLERTEWGLIGSATPGGWDADT
ncbi:MAG: RagB/SusD family nutrient uptake outer membrane protein, partial [Bacteroidota bacterium]